MLKHIATSTEHHIGHSLIHFAWNLSQTMIKGHERKNTKEDAAHCIYQYILYVGI